MFLLLYFTTLFNKTLENHYEITFMMTYAIYSVILFMLYFIVIGIFITIHIIRSFKNNLCMTIIEFLTFGLSGLYLSLFRVIYYILPNIGIIIYPDWILYNPNSTMCFGSLLFGVELAILVIFIRKNKVNK